MVVLMGTFGQFSGNGLGYFNLSIYEAVGYDSHMQFILNLVGSILSALGALTGVALSDRMPRRKVLVIGTFLSAFWLGINGGLSKVWADNEKKGIVDLGVGRGAVAAYFFFGITFSFSYTPLQALYPVCPRDLPLLALIDISPVGRVSRQCDSREGYGDVRCRGRTSWVRQYLCDTRGFKEHPVQLRLHLRRLGCDRIHHLVLFRGRDCWPYA